jgi:glycine oxidase
LRDRVPNLGNVIDSTPDLQTWFMPDDCRLRNPRHLEALVAACLQNGVQLIEHTSIDRLVVKNGAVESAQSNGKSFRADRYCITNGAWASKLLGSMQIETGILPVRGQMVLYKLDAPPFPFVINDGHRYLVPRHVLAGSCEEEVGFDDSTTETMLDDLQEWAERLCPVLSRPQVVRTWAGLRPGSFDTYPYLGTLHPLKNAFVASGHFRHGLHWSTATAVLMRQWMHGQETAIDLKPFCIQRGQTLGQHL